MEEGTSYSMLSETHRSLDYLLELAGEQIPHKIRNGIHNVHFSSKPNASPYFPCPLKETEAVSALKAVEGGVAAGIWELRSSNKPDSVSVDLERAACFLFSAYISTVDGLSKGDPAVKAKLKDTDLLQAQSILYRRFAANLYETKDPGKYFHIHGSLEATSTLNMLGLQGYRPDVTDYYDCMHTIESKARQFTTTELEAMNAERGQAGITCYKPSDFRKTEHGKMLSAEPPWRITNLENDSPPIPFAPTHATKGINKRLQPPRPQILDGIKVLELCRIIAGPSIGRTLAEYGASVLKITSPKLSDVPFFQVDGNLGKHCADLDLKTTSDRRRFEELLEEADVILDGYRPGSLERLGYGPHQIKERGRTRGKGYVYVSEDCFGHVGPWFSRPGWQQIADCATGVAWIQGWFMGLDEPVIPPFPQSDYGTGCMGAIAALTGLYRRAREGGSWWGGVSLCQYDVFLQGLGLYPEEVQQGMRERHDKEFFELRHADSVDEVGKRALRSIKRIHPELFEEGSGYCHESWASKYNAKIKFVKPVVSIEGTWQGFLRQSRPNGSDEADWEGWEVDEGMLVD
ncbi:MAG: hypothetical protein M1820_010738 [Bogoriella megaspora]|nr:MAG: hypothetical protein M1820_010738 [Bogoriella megaspora]